MDKYQKLCEYNNKTIKSGLAQSDIFMWSYDQCGALPINRQGAGEVNRGTFYKRTQGRCY